MGQRYTKRSFLALTGFATLSMNLPTPLTRRQHAIVVGNILGDGHLQLAPNSQKARLRFTHSAAQAPYVHWQYDQLSTLCTGVKQPYESLVKGYREYHGYTAYRTELTHYHTQFYWPTGLTKPKFRKSIPEDLSSILTHPISLMVWYLDDGTLRKDGGACRLATQGFSLDEHMILQECLASNFSVKSTIEKWKGRYGLLIPSRGGHSHHFVSLFAHTVLKEIPSMSYKVRREFSNG